MGKADKDKEEPGRRSTGSVVELLVMQKGRRNALPTSSHLTGLSVDV